MFEISVCVGSSCHLKGSYDVIQKLKEVIKKYDAENKVELKASFCLGQCSNGVTVLAGGEYLFNVSPENAEELFVKEILNRL